MFWTSTAYAMGAAPQGAEGGAGAAFASFVPLILMFAIFYFLLIRPQQKKAKEHKQMLGALKAGDRVITAGGLYGRILEANEESLLVDIGDTTVTVGRGYVSGVVTGGPRMGASDTKAKSKKSKSSDKVLEVKDDTKAESADKK